MPEEPAPEPATGIEETEEDLGRMLTQQEVAEILRVSRRTLQDWRTAAWRRRHSPEEWGPPFIRLGGCKKGHVRYSAQRLREWIQAQERLRATA